MGLAGSAILTQAAEAGLNTIAEAFADRAYQPSGDLVSRRDPGAVLHVPEAISTRMVRLATEGVIEAVDGSVLTLKADSICVHGDSPGAVSIAARVRETLQAAGVHISPMMGRPK